MSTTSIGESRPKPSANISSASTAGPPSVDVPSAMKRSSCASRCVGAVGESQLSDDFTRADAASFSLGARPGENVLWEVEPGWHGGRPTMLHDGGGSHKTLPIGLPAPVGPLIDGPLPLQLVGVAPRQFT